MNIKYPHGEDSDVEQEDPDHESLGLVQRDADAEVKNNSAGTTGVAGNQVHGEAPYSKEVEYGQGRGSTVGLLPPKDSEDEAPRRGGCCQSLVDCFETCCLMRFIGSISAVVFVGMAFSSMADVVTDALALLTLGEDHSSEPYFYMQLAGFLLGSRMGVLRQLRRWFGGSGYDVSTPGFLGHALWHMGFSWYYIKEDLIEPKLERYSLGPLRFDLKLLLLAVPFPGLSIIEDARSKTKNTYSQRNSFRGHNLNWSWYGPDLPLQSTGTDEEQPLEGEVAGNQQHQPRRDRCSIMRIIRSIQLLFIWGYLEVLILIFVPFYPLTMAYELMYAVFIRGRQDPGGTHAMRLWETGTSRVSGWSILCCPRAPRRSWYGRGEWDAETKSPLLPEVAWLPILELVEIAFCMPAQFWALADGAGDEAWIVWASAGLSILGLIKGLLTFKSNKFALELGGDPSTVQIQNGIEDIAAHMSLNYGPVKSVALFSTIGWNAFLLKERGTGGLKHAGRQKFPAFPRSMPQLEELWVLGSKPALDENNNPVVDKDDDGNDIPLDNDGNPAFQLQPKDLAKMPKPPSGSTPAGGAESKDDSGETAGCCYGTVEVVEGVPKLHSLAFIGCGLGKTVELDELTEIPKALRDQVDWMSLNDNDLKLDTKDGIQRLGKALSPANFPALKKLFAFDCGIEAKSGEALKKAREDVREVLEPKDENGTKLRVMEEIKTGKY